MWCLGTTRGQLMCRRKTFLPLVNLDTDFNVVPEFRNSVFNMFTKCEPVHAFCDIFFAFHTPIAYFFLC